MWRLWSQWSIEAAKKIVKLAVQYKAAVVVDKPLDESTRELREGGGLKSNAKKYLNTGRLVERLRELAEWYGVPYREERLYSTAACGHFVAVGLKATFTLDSAAPPSLLRIWGTGPQEVPGNTPPFPQHQHTTFNPPIYITPDSESYNLPESGIA